MYLSLNGSGRTEKQREKQNDNTSNDRNTSD